MMACVLPFLNVFLMASLSGASRLCWTIGGQVCCVLMEVLLSFYVLMFCNRFLKNFTPPFYFSEPSYLFCSIVLDSYTPLPSESIIVLLPCTVQVPCCHLDHPQSSGAGCLSQVQAANSWWCAQLCQLPALCPFSWSFLWCQRNIPGGCCRETSFSPRQEWWLGQARMKKILQIDHLSHREQQTHSATWWQGAGFSTRAVATF